MGKCQLSGKRSVSLCFLGELPVKDGGWCPSILADLFYWNPTGRAGNILPVGDTVDVQ
jgi:hypothetical protein